MKVNVDESIYVQYMYTLIHQYRYDELRWAHKAPALELKIMGDACVCELALRASELTR